MNRQAKKIASLLLSATLLCGSLTLVGCGVREVSDDDFRSSPSYSFDLLSNEKPTINSTIPHTFIDLTTYYTFAGVGNMTVKVTEGSHTTFTATTDDPMATLYTPKFKPSECKSVAIIYRTDMDKDGELYADR